MSAVPGIVPGPTDVRRAAALLIHANPDALNPAGVAAIVAELKGDLRITEVLTALCAIAYATEHLDTPEGQAGLARIVADFAARENRKENN